ncbi:MAG: alginate lyase family protein [Opitutaceae bacterium]|nr:alginate lyase family protein [Opitutaceae bacterium]
MKPLPPTILRPPWFGIMVAAIALWLGQGLAAADASPFVHPGLLQSQADLAAVKQKILAGEQPWKDAFERLRTPRGGRGGAPGTPLLAFKPQPFTHVIRGPYGRPAIGANELSSSADAAADAAFIWFVTGDRAYAAKAIEIINAWSATLWDFDDNDAKLLVGWTGQTWCHAAEILRSTDAGWLAADIEQFKRMLRTVYHPLIGNFFPEANGNWDAALMAAVISMAVFLDDRAMFDRVVNHFLRGPGNSGITKYIYPSGQCQETTRDAAHTQLGLGYLATVCQIAWTQGVDLYSAADNRLAVGLEYSAKYFSGEPVPIKGIPSAPGRFADIYHSAYAHYRTVKGIEMPFTAKAVEATLARSGLKLLTSYRVPRPAPPPPAGVPQPSAIATKAGARAQPTATPPAGAIMVAPGESIQAALDAQAGKGGWVVLGQGVHTLPAMLKMRSGVTLAGQGRDTIVFLDPKLTAQIAGTAIVNAEPDLHDVTLRDFVIEGATITARATSNDPNQDRRQRSYQMAPSRAGIAFAGQREGQMKNLRFEHVTVRNCTHNGVAIRGAAGVAIVACDFSDSGGSVVPGAGLQHNLLLTHVSGAEVRDSQFDTSPWGSGIDVSFSREFAITGNETARNALHGIRVADSRNVRLTGNLSEGNDGDGIAFVTLMDGCRQIEARDNVVRNNGGAGLGPLPAGAGTLAANRSIDNGR